VNILAKSEPTFENGLKVSNLSSILLVLHYKSNSLRFDISDMV